MRIVVNADDFGYSADTVEATIACFERNLLTSASIMPNMPATKAALEFARERSDLSFGVHLTFVGDGSERPLSAPGDIPSLVDADGAFPRRTRDVRRRALLGQLSVEEIAREMDAQVRSVQDEGVRVTHVDSHRHLHKFAPFRRALAVVLPHLGISRVRAIQDVYLGRPLGSPTYWLGPIWRRRLKTLFISTDHFYMPTTAGDQGWQSVLAIVDGLGGDSLEVGVHPGMDGGWRQQELEGLEAFTGEALKSGHVLIGWHEVDSGDRP